MNLHCSLAQAVESSEGSSSGGEPSVPSRSTSIASGFLCSAKMTESLSRSRSGRTSEHSTGNPGLDAWISSQAGSRARTSVRPEKAQESTGNDQDFGWRWHGSFAKYDPATSSWKTRQCSLLGGLEEFSETWPKWGLMRDGECLERLTLAPRTCVNEYGLWQTLTADDAIQRKNGKWNSRGEPKLSAQVRFPTLTCHDRKGRSGAKRGRNANGGPTLTMVVGGTLNPTWCEWFMGFPMGWSESEPLEMRRFQRWLEQHGEY
jgi:hypothetical protein